MGTHPHGGDGDRAVSELQTPKQRYWSLDQWFGGREAEPETGSEGWAGGHGEKQALGLGGTWHAMETKDHNSLSTSCEPILLWALYRGRYCGPSGCPGSPESWTEPRARRQHLHL